MCYVDFNVFIVFVRETGPIRGGKSLMAVRYPYPSGFYEGPHTAGFASFVCVCLTNTKVV